MAKNLFFLLILNTVLIPSGFGQKLDHVPGEFLIQLRSTKDLELLKAKVQQQSRSLAKFQLSLTTEFPIVYSAQIDPNTIHEIDFLRWLRDQPEVATAQFNHILDWRGTTPNDPLFSDQWHYINFGNNGGVAGYDLDAELAWDMTTGGLTPRGDTIVVAVVDNGVYPTHPDLVENLWINHREIPDNNIDDDGNGYLDDYYGWNITTQSDLINPSGISGHGTAVAGMIGAKGNNQIGVAGINWDIKLMIISNPEIFTEARALQAYAYLFKMRQLYNETNGKKGAFIVASNSSWGKDFGFPEDAPIWCEMYDQLGQVGILNCGATANADINIDLKGDLPSTCPSDYLLAVTNLDHTGSKVMNAGYGMEHIDLASFGEMAFTITRPNIFYKPFLGTSAASPQVAGAIALLYSSPCGKLTDLAKSDPEAAALLARDFILNGTVTNSNLNGLTATSGQLNLFNSVQLSVDACGSCPVVEDISFQTLVSGEVEINWQLPYYGLNSNLRYRVKGNSDWQEIANLKPPYTLTGLTACMTYQVEIQTRCANEESAFSATKEFQSADCCFPPSDLTTNFIDEESIAVSWETVNLASEYLIRYRILGSTEWLELESDTTETLLENLLACQRYELSIESKCSSAPSMGFSEIVFFRTKGCGACLDYSYCPSFGNTNYEWISNIQLNDLNKTSQSSNGYQNFTNESTTLITYDSYEIVLEPGYQGVAIKEYFQVWIDYNQDGDFSDLEELAYRSPYPRKGIQLGQINVPYSALPGPTRMRVSMSYGNDEFPNPCSQNFNGEVEDYCITIEQGAAQCDVPINLDTFSTGKNYLAVQWEDFTDDHSDHNIRYRPQTDSTAWIEEFNVESPHFLLDLDPCLPYIIQVEANCSSGGISGYTSEMTVLTACNSNLASPPGPAQFKINPNPFSDVLYLQFELDENSPLLIQLYATNGQIIYQQKIAENTFGLNKIEVNELSNLTSGIYLLKVTSNTGSAFRKVIKF